MTTEDIIQTQTDFFVSFSGHDKEWADWIAWTLDEEGYSVVYQPWDFEPGTNFVLQMNKAAGSGKTIAVISDNYLSSNFTQPEWAAAFAADPTGVGKKLIPVRISECDLKGTLLAQVVYIDLVGIFDKDIAKQVMLDGLTGCKPSEPPEFPSSTGKTPPFPGTIADPATRNSSQRERVSSLPPPGIRVPFSSTYYPPTFRGVQVHRDNPLILDFILDSGDSKLTLRNLGEVSLRLTKYFLTSLTVPDDHLWVNLSPYEKERVIPDDLAQTQMGVDLLVQDYILKQVTSTALYPEKVTGRKYWQKIYELTGGDTDPDTINTYNKIWITPESAKIIERGTFAIIEDSKLRVQTEKDYLTTAAHQSNDKTSSNQSLNSNDQIVENVFKQIILPIIESDVNVGGNFAVLRQIYSSLVLSIWYKEAIKRSIVADLYVDQGLTSSMGYSSKTTPEAVYDQYLEAFRVGVFEYIREDVVGPSADDILPRKYFSGGFTGAKIREIAEKNVSEKLTLKSNSSTQEGKLYWVRMNLNEDDKDLIDENYYGAENVGGIDLSTNGEFDLNIDKVGDGIQFQLSQKIIDRLQQTGMGRLRPNVMFVKHIDHDRLEISEKSDLSEMLKDIADTRSNANSEFLLSSEDGVRSRLRRAWDILRGT